MATRSITLAFAGSADSTLENTKDLLGDFLNFEGEDADGFPVLPEELDLQVVLPLTPDMGNGLLSVFDWTEYADLGYGLLVDETVDKKRKKNSNEETALKYAEGDPVVVPNVNPAMIEALREAKEAGRETYLVLLWGEEGDENSETLLDLADSFGIPALDLTAGLDDLKFTDEDPVEESTPEPEPEPEPAPEPARTRGRRRSLEVEETPLEEKPEPETPKLDALVAETPAWEEPAAEPEVQTPARRTRAKAEPKAAPVTPTPEDEPSLQEQIAEAVHATMGDADALTKGIAAKHEAKRREVSPEIRNRVSYHPGNDQTVPLHEAVRKATLDFLHLLDGLVPDGREKALAMTNGEQAMFWANAGIARSGGTTEVAEETAQEEAPAPSRGRGRPRKDGSDPQPRTAADKAVTEIWDEDEEAWKPKGRGRTPKGAKTRLVDPVTGDVVEAD